MDFIVKCTILELPKTAFLLVQRNAASGKEVKVQVVATVGAMNLKCLAEARLGRGQTDCVIWACMDTRRFILKGSMNFIGSAKVTDVLHITPSKDTMEDIIEAWNKLAVKGYVDQMKYTYEDAVQIALQSFANDKLLEEAKQKAQEEEKKKAETGGRSPSQL